MCGHEHMLTARCNRNYPWSMYAVFQTTITQWAFVYDVALAVCFHFTLSEAGCYAVADEGPRTGWATSPLWAWALFLGHWLFSKTIKLVPHLLRNPGDVRFVPVSILFGYFHNLIKLYGCITVTEVCFSTPRSSIFVCRCTGPRLVFAC